MRSSSDLYVCGRAGSGTLERVKESEERESVSVFKSGKTRSSAHRWRRLLQVACARQTSPSSSFPLHSCVRSFDSGAAMQTLSEASRLDVVPALTECGPECADSEVHVGHAFLLCKCFRRRLDGVEGMSDSSNAVRFDARDVSV